MSSGPARPNTSSGFNVSLSRCWAPVLLAWLYVVPSGQSHPPIRDGEGVVVAIEGRNSTPQPDDRARITVTGARVSKGNAVDCPKIRTDDGQIYSVSYLAPSIAIGDRVSVTGYMAYSTTCLGPVLKAEKVVHQQ